VQHNWHCGAHGRRNSRSLAHRYPVVTPRFVQVRAPIDAVDLHSERCTVSTVRGAADIHPTEDATHHRTDDVQRCTTRTPTSVAATRLVLGDDDDVHEGNGSWERLGDVGWEGLGDTGWHTEVPTWTPTRDAARSPPP
jgi:hypothetical protein